MDSKQFQAAVDKKNQNPEYQKAVAAKLVAQGLEAPSGAKPGLNKGGVK
jgi:hypothetical protein